MLSNLRPFNPPFFQTPAPIVLVAAIDAALALGCMVFAAILKVSLRSNPTPYSGPSLLRPIISYAAQRWNRFTLM